MKALIIALLYLNALGIAEWWIRRSILLAGLYLLLSTVTFIMYAIDKWAAVKGRWRIPEAHLHLVALIGGWPGAMVAQQKLRHKSKKQTFRFVFWITVALNIAASLWLLTARGMDILDSLL